MNATDPDGMNEQIRYRLAGTSTVDLFAIDDVTGIIRIARGADLEWDAEAPLHALQVLAIDQGLPHAQTATAQLTVHIDDVNDKAPRFERSLFVHHVAEVTAVGRQVLVLAATDPDTTPQLRFRLIPPFQTRNKGGYLHSEDHSQYFASVVIIFWNTYIHPLLSFDYFSKLIECNFKLKLDHVLRDFEKFTSYNLNYNECSTARRENLNILTILTFFFK